MHGNPLLRLLNEDDVVPMVPPITLISARQGVYRHFGPEAILLPSGDFLYLHEHDAERLAVTDTWSNLGHLSIEQHRSALYLERVQAPARR